MANTYLISQVASGVTTYYTAAAGVLTSIGSAQDFTKGFDNTQLALLDNGDYAPLFGVLDQNTVQLLIQADAGTTPTVDITPVNHGTVQTTPITSIDLHGYSGINSITVEGTGGKYAVSFDGGSSWKSRVMSGYSGKTSLLPRMASTTANGYTIGGTTPMQNSVVEMFNEGVAATMYSLSSNPEIVITCPTAELVNGLAITGSSLYYELKGFEFYGGNNGSWELLLTDNTIIGDTAETATFDIVPTKAYEQYKIKITAVGAMLAANIDEIKLFKPATIDYAWQTIQPSELPTKGMTQTTLETLQSGDFAPIFQSTQLDILAYLEGTDSMTSFVVALPPNAGPIIANLTATPDTMHRETITVSCNIYDLEKDSITYRALFNGEEYTKPAAVPTDGKVNVVFPDTLFPVGTTAIKIEATDARDVMTESAIYITRVNTAPKITSVLSGNQYHATIGDDDNDKVQYRILINGVEKSTWNELSASPVTLLYEVDRGEIIFNKANTIRLEIKDEFGAESFCEEEFVGSYYGIMFVDPTGNYFSTDLGTLIKKLDFGTLIASQCSLAKEVQTINKFGFDVNNLVINTTPELPTKVFVEMCETDAPFVPVTELRLGALAQNAKKSFFVRIISVKDSFGGGDFNINATANPA